MKVLHLSNRQIEFIKEAIKGRYIIIPFEVLTDNNFKEKYSISKEQYEAEILDIERKLI